MIRNDFPQVEDFELYKNVQKCAEEVAQREEWMKKSELWKKDLATLIDDQGKQLTTHERMVIKYLKGDASFEEIGINKLNAERLLRIVKIVDLALKPARSTYPLRKQILQLCSPHMTSCRAYTKTVDPKKMEDIDYLCQPENWVAEEVGHQANAIAAHFARLVGFSKQFKAPVFYAIRGNTGAGKTSMLHEIFKYDELPVLSLDPLKYFLKRQLKLTNVQVYEEANALFANYLNGVFKQKALRFIFDSRLLTLDYVKKNVIQPAKERGEEVNLIDLDVPLSHSLLRSLVRDPYGREACVPTDAVEWGYLRIRAEREPLIAFIKETSHVTSYKLYNGKTLVAEKREDGFHILSQELYAASLQIPSQEEREECLNSVIDASFIEKALTDGQIYPSQKEALAKWSGKTVGEALRAHAYQIPDRPDEVIPPDGVRFEVPCDDLLLAKYEEFYKKMAIKYIAADLEKLEGKWKISPDGKTIHVEKLPYYYPSKNIFVAIPILLRDEETRQTISISSRVDLNNGDHFYTDLIAYAKQHENPVRFLIDHFRLWSFHLDEVVEFLSDYPTQYGVMDIFEKILDSEKSAGCVYFALGKAYQEPTLKERAKDLLFKHGGLSTLAPHLHEEDVKARFEEIVVNCPNYQRRFAALGYLEKTAPALQEVETEICREIIAPLLDFKDLSYLENVLWMMPGSGYAALGGRDITDRVCALLLKEDNRTPLIEITAPYRGLTPLGGGHGEFTQGSYLYSILKYIAIHTKDRSEFDQIVKTLIAFGQDRKLGFIDDLETVLCHIHFYNPQFPLPRGAKISQKTPKRKERPQSAISGMFSREREYDRWWDSYNTLLDATIRNPDLPQESRIAALRQCADPLFIPPKHYICQSDRHKRKLVKPALEALLADSATPERLRFEAKRILEWDYFSNVKLS